MKLPEIRIKDGWLLRENASRHFNDFWGEGQPMRSDEEYMQVVINYQDAWQPYEKQILTYMCERLGLRFRQDIIDVYIAPWFYAFSDPMVLGVRFSDEEFVDCLTHELLHRLLTDNTSVSHYHHIGDDWQKLFGKADSFTTTVHIPVHAVHKAIYFDLLNAPNRYKHEIKQLKENSATDYLASWEYVNQHDYNTIINDLKKLYESLQANKK